MSQPHLTRIIPPEKSGEFSDIYDIYKKRASFMGTILMGLLAQIAGKPGNGVAILVVMLLIGYVLFRKAATVNASKFQQSG